MTTLIENMLGSLVLLVGVLLVGSYLYSRVLGLKGSGTNGFIRVVTSVPLGPKKSIAVVVVGSQYLVVGITQDSITYLTRIEDIEGIKDYESSFRTKEVSGLKGVLTAVKENFKKGVGLKQ